MQTICTIALMAVMIGCTSPSGLVVTHTPNPCDIHTASLPGKPPFPYMWFYRTEVRNETDQPIQITRFEVYFYQDSQWTPANILNRPLTANDFSKWYSDGEPVTNGWIQPRTSAVCDPNWHGMPTPTSPRYKWTYDGVDTQGARYHVEAEIKSVPVNER